MKRNAVVEAARGGEASLTTPADCNLLASECITQMELDLAASWLERRGGTRLVEIFHDHGQYCDYYSNYDTYARLRPMQRALHGKSRTLIIFTCSGNGKSACLAGFSTIAWDFKKGFRNPTHHVCLDDPGAWIGVVSSSTQGDSQKLVRRGGAAETICNEMINVGPWYVRDLGFWDTVWHSGTSYSAIGRAYPKPAGHTFLHSRWNFVPGEIIVLQEVEERESLARWA